MSEPLLLAGKSPAMRAAMVCCSRFAPAPWPVLIQGEPGTGKTALAAHLHRLSQRKGEFVKRNFGSHTGDLEYDTLAGHAAGSFTGAFKDRKGLVEAAQGGTLFLDEIALAPPRVQEMLLELLDEGQLHRLGEYRRRPLDVRIVAATNADLKQKVRDGTFRQDLLDRLGWLRIQVPPLRERRDEILPLADFFLARAAKIFPGYSPALSIEARDCLVEFPWPGNVREVAGAVQYAVLMAHPARGIGAEHLPRELSQPGERRRGERRRVSREEVQVALAAANGSKTSAARDLGISRKHLYAVLKRA